MVNHKHHDVHYPRLYTYGLLLRKNIWPVFWSVGVNMTTGVDWAVFPFVTYRRLLVITESQLTWN